MKTTLRKGFYVLDLMVLVLMEISLGHTFTVASYLPIILLHYLELLRFNSVFLLYRREKKAILPIVFFTVVFGTFYVSGMFNETIRNMAQFPKIALGIGDSDDAFYATYTIEREIAGEITVRFILLWAWLMPIITYVIQFTMKRVRTNGYTWKQLAGLAIFNDKAGRLFVSLAVLMFIALLSGIHMQQGISYYAIIILPLVAYYFLNNYIDRKVHWLEYVLLLVAMLIFNKAQYRCDTERVLRLVLSPAIVLAVCVWMMAQTKKMFVPMLTFFMTAFLLPVSSVGYNIYAVLDGARGMNYSDMDTHQGVMFVNNRHSENGQVQIRFGLRDRYGEILPCTYRSIIPTNILRNEVTCRTDEGGFVYDVKLKSIVSSYSTQDSTLNEFVRKAVLEPLLNKGFVDGQIVIMESETGKIRSMVGLSDSSEDNYDFSKPVKYSGLMMPVSMIAALGSKTNVFLPDSVVGTSTSMTIEDALVQESYEGVGKAIKQAYGNDINRFWWNLQEIGFCHYNDRAAWGLGDIDTIRFCQYPSYEEIDDHTIERLATGLDRPVTALQMLDVYNTIANDGREYRPLLYEDFIKSRQGEISSYDAHLFKEIFKKSFGATCKKYGIQNKGVFGYYTTYKDDTDANSPIVYTNVCVYVNTKKNRYTLILALRGNAKTEDRKTVLEGIMRLSDRL